MSERTMEARGESGVQDIAPQSEGVKDLTPKEIIALPIEKFEERLDGIFGGETVRPVKQNPEESKNSLGERLVAAAVVGPLLFGAGVALSPTEAKAETAVVTEGTVPSESGLDGYKITTPAPNPEPVLPTPEAPLTEHYTERQRKIDEYKRQLVEYAGENINLKICANVVYGLLDAPLIGDPTYIHPEKAIVSNYATVNEVFEFYKNGKFEKKSNLRAVYYKDENGNPTEEAGLISVVNPKIKTMSVDAISSVIDEWEHISPGFLRGLNANNVFMVFQSDAKGSQGVKYNDVEIYFNYSGKHTDPFRGALPVEQFGVRCMALGGKFSADNMDGVLKPRFAVLCCKSLLSIVDQEYYDFVNYLYTRFQKEEASYVIFFLGNRTLDYVNNLMVEAKSKNLFTPFGAKNWEEIDVISATAKVD